MEVCMSTKQDLMMMSKSELRAYVLQHREDEEALQVYLDKVHTENPNAHIHSPTEDVRDALARYIDSQKEGL
jgi:DNA-binding phage protein